MSKFQESECRVWMFPFLFTSDLIFISIPSFLLRPDSSGCGSDGWRRGETEPRRHPRRLQSRHHSLLPQGLPALETDDGSSLAACLITGSVKSAAPPQCLRRDLQRISCSMRQGVERQIAYPNGFKVMRRSLLFPKRRISSSIESHDCSHSQEELNGEA